jgi:hypothetical protein
MTIEQLLEMSVEKLESMTDQQLIDYFGPEVLSITRPDPNKKKEEKTIVSEESHANRVVNKTPHRVDNISKARDLAKKLGIELPI